MGSNMLKIWRSSLASLTAGLLLLGPLPVYAQDDFSFEIVEDKVQDTDTAQYQQAKDLLSQERFGEALSLLEAVLGNKKLKKVHPAAQYDIAKALFRMGAYHAALARFKLILDDGPKHEYFSQSREWLFFISRKMKDELQPLQMISVYARSEDIPAEQQSELSYALGRYYFLNALDQGAKGVEVEQSAEAPPEPASDAAGMDVSGDELKGEGEGEGEDDGGFNFSTDDLGGGDDDGFDFSDDAPKKGKKAKKAKKPAKKPAKKDDLKANTEPAVEAAPVKEKTHKRENPKNAEESLELSLKSIQRVKDKFPAYADALYLKGLGHFARGEFDPAVKAFRDVVRLTNPRGEGTVENAKLREMAFFSLARIHYQFEQFRYAIFYYDRISRDSEQWLDALFESSWAHFRLGEYEKALGNLVTLQSPFFLDEYYPEASILKAITFYENCRYPEARAFLGEFKENYGGVVAELDRLVGVEGGEPKSAERLFEDLTSLEQKVAEGKDDAARSIALTARLLRLALSDKRVSGYRDAIAEIDEEKQKLMALESPFNGGAIHADLVKGLDQRRVEVVKAAGGLLRDKLQAERGFLRDLTSKLVRIQFEIAKMEKETLEASLSNQNQAVSLGDYRFTTATDDERLYWPFEGEYWRDELGTYQYTLTRGCRPPSETTITGN